MKKIRSLIILAVQDFLFSKLPWRLPESVYGIEIWGVRGRNRSLMCRLSAKATTAFQCWYRVLSTTIVMSRLGYCFLSCTKKAMMTWALTKEVLIKVLTSWLIAFKAASTLMRLRPDQAWPAPERRNSRFTHRIVQQNCESTKWAIHTQQYFLTFLSGYCFSINRQTF